MEKCIRAFSSCELFQSCSMGLICISYCPHARALTDINDRGKVELLEQRSRVQPETVRGQPAFPRSLMSVNARVV